MGRFEGSRSTRRGGGASARRWALAGALVAVSTIAAAGCRANDEPPRAPAACLEGAGQLRTALRAAPRPVKLTDGTRLSTCVDRARSHAELQQLGAIYTQVADRLAADLAVSRGAAVRLGYLTAATEQGARQTNGIHEELVRRLRQSVGLDGPPAHHRAAYEEGLAAGRRGG